MKAYISGPMRGYPDLNRPAFHAAEHALQEAGWCTINPARLDEARPYTGRPGLPEARFYAERDLAAILSLRAEKSDVVVVLPGWQGSSGAVAEVSLAAWVGLPVLMLEEAV